MTVSMKNLRRWMGGMALAVCFLSMTTRAADWPTYRADNARSGTNSDALALPLSNTWSFQSKHKPEPAWKGEAKWDGWNKVYNLKSRQTFDYAFQTTLVGDSVYFGSSVDDKVYCLDAATGKERWHFFTEGPVRFAPTLHEGRAYVGSDDGNVYCLDADSGKVIWQVRVGPRDYRIAGNGRVISAWPARAGVVIQDGIVYTAGGMFPSEGVHICALELSTGKVLWRQVQTDLPAQGYLLASPTRLYVPSGRNNPVVLDIADGKRLRVVQGQGGTYALLAGKSLIFGPGKVGQLGVIDGEASDQLAQFSGNHMIISQGKSYLHSDFELTALDRDRYMALARERKTALTEQSTKSDRLSKLRKEGKGSGDEAKGLRRLVLELGRQIDDLSSEMGKCELWKKPCDFPLDLILVGSHLVAGGEGRVGIHDAETGDLVWSADVNGRVFGLASSRHRLFVSTDEGTIHCFTGGQQALLNE